MTAMLRSRDSVTGLLLVALGAGVLWATADFAISAPVSEDAALLPRVVAVGLVVCGVILVLLGLADRRLRVTSGAGAASASSGLPVEEHDEVTQESDMVKPGWQVAIAFGAAMVVYSYSAFELGFIVSTIAFIIAVGFILGRNRDIRSIVTLIIYAVGIAGAAFIGFFELLNVRLPITPLF